MRWLQHTSMISQEAYLDYTTMAGNLQDLDFTVSNMKLLSVLEYGKQIKEVKTKRLREAESRSQAA